MCSDSRASSTDLLRRLVLVAALSLASLGVGCSGHPIPLKAQAGSTIFIPVGGMGAEYKQGFGSEFTKAMGDYDDQRGELVFYLTIAATSPSQPTECPSSQQQFKLRTRFVTRVQPDVAASAGMPSSFIAYGGEILAVVDIPRTDAPVDPGPNVGTQECLFDVSIKHRRREVPSSLSTPIYEAEVPFSTFTPPSPIRITISPGTGASVPSEVFQGALSVQGSDLNTRLVDTIPAPQLVFWLSTQAPGGPNVPAAAEIELDYPANKIQILSVAEFQHRRIASMIRWQAVDADTIRIFLVDPDRSVSNIGVAFRLLAPTQQGRALVSDFSIANWKFFGPTGAPISPQAGYPSLGYFM